jgi:CheY-like chemotaxis protein
MTTLEANALQLEAANLKLTDLNRDLLKRAEALREELNQVQTICARQSSQYAKLAEDRDRAVQSNASMQRFLASMSHQIRTPMTGLLGMIDFTLESDLRPDQLSQLKIARKAGKELVKVINEILGFTRLEAGGRPVPLAPVAPLRSAAPLAPVAAARTQLHPSGSKSGASWPPPLTVLIAEDDSTIMEVMTRLTGQAGHLVVVAGDGYEALSLWENERPYLVLMDVEMPGLDGLEATRRIREREKEIGGQVPIYGLTAHVLNEDIERCLAAGMTGHIGKPIDFLELLEILTRHRQFECHPNSAGDTPAEGGRHVQSNHGCTAHAS